MSLNLLLGFTGQLSLGHIAFFGIGAYVSALTSLGFDAGLPFGFRMVHEPWPPIVGFVLAIVVAGFCGYLVGLLSFRVRGAYFVIVTISLCRSGPAGGAQLGRADAGPAGADQYSLDHDRIAGAGGSDPSHQAAELLSRACRGGYRLCADRAPGPFPFRPRHARADGERDAGGLGRHRRHENADAGGGDLGRRSPAPPAVSMRITSGSSIPRCLPSSTP